MPPCTLAAFGRTLSIRHVSGLVGSRLGIVTFAKSALAAHTQSGYIESTAECSPFIDAMLLKQCSNRPQVTCDVDDEVCVVL